MYGNTLVSHRQRRMFARDTEGGSGGGGEGGGSGSGGGGDSGQGSGSGGGGNTDTGGSEFTPITNQEEFDRRIRRRISQVEGRYADYDTVSEKARQFDLLEAESRTEHERRVAEAKTAAERETAAKYIPELVTTQFEVAASGKMGEDQLKALLEDLDPYKFVDKDGKPDRDKIKKKVTALAGTGTGNGGSNPDLGQGGGGGGQHSRGEDGRAEAERRYGKDKVQAGRMS